MTLEQAASILEAFDSPEKLLALPPYLVPKELKNQVAAFRNANAQVNVIIPKIKGRYQEAHAKALKAQQAAEAKAEAEAKAKAEAATENASPDTTAQ